ncbi:MAG: hypothetical protein HY763_00545 [Planctomycetes bacterium]|nr:hypothetical protein [Planctomycetota bacterium]
MRRDRVARATTCRPVSQRSVPWLAGAAALVGLTLAGGAGVLALAGDAPDTSGLRQAADRGPATAAAGPGVVIQPGMDVFRTVAPTDVTFGGPSIPPIPPGFFFPGSPPFSGTVQMTGRPIDPATYDLTDTMVRRLAPGNLPGLGSSTTIPIELVAMELRSVAPITVSPGSQWDVTVVRSGPSPGNMTVRLLVPDGGDYNCVVQVTTDIIFTPVGGGPEQTMPGVVVNLQDFGASNEWQTTPVTHNYPQTGPNFYSRLNPYTLRDPGSVTHTIEPPPPPPDYHETWLPYDHLTEQSGVDFGSPSNPPIPAGFFGPGSDPFLGHVSLRGAPLDPANLGQTSAVLRRTADPTFPVDLPGTMGTVPIEIVQLSLVSANPITVTYGGGSPEQWDVRVDLSPTVTPPPGSLTATKTHPNGGTYDSVIHVQPRFTFVRQSLPGTAVLDTGSAGLPFYQFQFSNVPYVQVVNPSLAASIVVYPGAQWVGGVEEQPSSGQQRRVPSSGTDPSIPATHTVDPPPRKPPDYHQTWVPDNLSFDGTVVLFGSAEVPPIPAGFFNPGSQPFEGTVALRGEPINQAEFGDASVILQRADDPVRPSDPDGTMGTVPIEMVALNLVSAQPIIVSYGTGTPEIWDVRVGLSPLPAPAGSLTATKTHANGGDASVSLNVNALLTFTNVHTGDVRIMTASISSLSAMNMGFVFNVNPTLASDLYFDPNATWVSGIRELNPGDPTSQVPETATLANIDGGVRHSVCPPRRVKRVCVYNVTCADGPCKLCPLCTGDVCQGFACPNLTCAGSYSAQCNDCCLEFTLINCQPPNNERFCPVTQPCPCDPTPGACCFADGTCTVVPQCECNGTYLGDGTTCSGNVGACCFPGGGCAEMDETCCVMQGGIFEGGTCDPPVGCCFNDGSCQMLDPECCVLLGGTLDPDGACNPPERCCMPDGSCLNTDPGCCQLAGGVPGGPGSACGPPRRCCVNGTCIDTDPQCCLLAGGVVGPGLCQPALECCVGLVCVDIDPFCCQLPPLGGTPGVAPCGPLQECCAGDGSCIDADSTCCVLNGDTPGPGLCDPVEACCLPVGAGGVAGCAQAEPDCCVTDLNGFPDGVGACVPNQACCLANGDCISDDPQCCPNRGGTPQGPGSVCTAPEACCINGTCVLMEPQCCVQSGGAPQGFGSTCPAAPQACCLNNGLVCQNLDAICCDDQGGVPAAGNCQGNSNADPRDDACEGGPGINPPQPAPSPHDRRKNRYVSFAPNNGAAVKFLVRRIYPPPVTDIGWVGPPDGNGISLILPLNQKPPLRVWNEPVIHAGDCEIHPWPESATAPLVCSISGAPCLLMCGAGQCPPGQGECQPPPSTWHILATVDNTNFSPPLVVETVPRPCPKKWGDIVGDFSGGSWTPPNGISSVNDFLAALQCFQVLPTRPHVTVCDVVGAGALGFEACINRSGNIGDVFNLIKAFQGGAYPAYVCSISGHGCSNLGAPCVAPGVGTCSVPDGTICPACP